VAEQGEGSRALKRCPQFVRGGKPLSAFCALGKMIVYAEKFFGRSPPSPVARDLLF
jgi:hypothetical protein